MKTTAPIPELIMPDLDDIPLQRQANKIADIIVDTLEDALDNNSLSIIEMAGLLGMGASLRDYADGRIKGVMAHSFMRSLADRKTPMPVQRTESVTHFDIKSNLNSIIEKNSDALQRTNEMADKKRAEIRARLKADNLLMLRKSDVEDIAKSEPDEISRIRRESNG